VIAFFCWYWSNCWPSLFKEKFEDTKGVIFFLTYLYSPTQASI
jgi:hypothetical protein